MQTRNGKMARIVSKVQTIKYLIVNKQLCGMLHVPVSQQLHNI